MIKSNGEESVPSYFGECSPALLCISVSSLGFEGLLLAVPALILQLLQLLQDSSGLVGGVDQHAQQLEAKAEFRFKKINHLPVQLRHSQEESEQLHKHEGTKTERQTQITLVFTNRGLLQNCMLTHTQKVHVHVHAQTQSLEKLRGCFAERWWRCVCVNTFD